MDNDLSSSTSYDLVAPPYDDLSSSGDLLASALADRPTSTASTPYISSALDKATEQADLEELAVLALQDGGYQTDALRCRIWPLLLGVTASAPTTRPVIDQIGVEEVDASPAARSGLSDQQDEASLPEHPEEQQVELDVKRSFVHLLDGPHRSLAHGHRCS